MSRMTGMTWVTRALSILNLSEMTGQPILIIMRILVLIKTNRPDQSKAKHYTQRKWFFSKTSWKMPIVFKLGIPIDRVPTSKSCVFCLGIKFLFFPFDRFLVPSCCKDYFLEKFSDSVWWLYKPAM